MSESPATKLLEKRRMMYESQEQYKQQKKIFQQQEVKFKIQEDELDKEDTNLQAQLIKSAGFLEQNELQKSKCDKRTKQAQEQNI